MILKNPEVRIENTNLCNTSCSICPREKMTRPKTTMPYSHFVSLVDQSKELGAETISVFGYGEPLIDKTFIDKIAYCDRKGLKTFVTTNAALLDLTKVNPLLDAGLDHIRFSVHALFPAEYKHIHRLDFEETIRNIFNFIVVNKKKYDHRCLVSVSVIPLHKEKVELIRKYWEPIVDYLEIWKPHNWTDGRQYRKVKPKKKTCFRPFSGPVQINADGKVMVCCFDYDAKLTVGDTYKQSIEDILSGPLFEEIREKHRQGNLEGLICKSCDQLNEEEESPLLYSNRDKTKTLNCTSSTKFNLNGG